MFLKLLLIYGLFHFDSQSYLNMFRCNQWRPFSPIISFFRKLKTRTFRTNLRKKLFCNTKSYSWNLFEFAANINMFSILLQFCSSTSRKAFSCTENQHELSIFLHYLLKYYLILMTCRVFNLLNLTCAEQWKFSKVLT